MDAPERKKIRLRVIEGPANGTEPVGGEVFQLAQAEQNRHPQPGIMVVSPRDQVVKIASGTPAEALAAIPVQSEAEHVPKSGQTLEKRYYLQEEIGRGGVCLVFKAVDTLLGMTVAIKVLRPEAAKDPDFVQTLLDEARSAMQISHSQIVRLHTLQETAGFYFLVMEYLEGQTLRECLADYGKLPVHTVAQVVEACHAPLRHAHKRGLLHNDLKPDNLLLTHSGTIKLIDFGLSCLANTPTGNHALLGTPAYMSPERLRREVLDSRSDIYSLGLTSYELLSGQLPFPEGLAAEKYLALADFSLDELTSPLREVIEKAVAHDRQQRWETLDEFVDAFLAAVQPV